MTSPLENPEHTHPSSDPRYGAHSHAYGQHPHDHFLRAVCGREECRNFKTHNIHARPDDQ